MKNSGNVTVSDITVTDPLTNLNQSVGTLAPGVSAEAITTTYTVQEKDILAGKIENTATATGTDPDGDPVTGSGTEMITDEPSPDKPDKPVIEAPKGALTVEKTADKTEGAALGEEITYTITVTNSGNVTVKDITVTDPLTGLEQSAGTLAPGASTSVTTKHKITEADILAGSFENTATATGKDPKNGDVTGEGKATVTTVEQNPALTVVKTANKTEGAALGEEITYTITVTNSGNVTVSDITVTDPKTGLNETIESLAPSESKEYTTKHTITEADILAGSFENTATAKGTDPKGSEVFGSDDETVTTVAQNPALTVEKTANKTSGAALGEEITYTITVTNSGNVTVSNIAVNDPLTGLNETIESLAPGASKEYTTTHTITEADILAGSFENTATATGTDPDGEEVTNSGSATVTTVEQAPALTVEKKADKTSDAALGEEISYTITVTNSGNVTVSDITVADPLTDLEQNVGTLAPNASTSVTTTHTITEADILADSFVNTATATGTNPNGGEVTGSDDETVTTVEQNAALTVEKTASGTGPVDLGKPITYTITVTNSGNVTVSGITVTDPLTDLEQNVGTLAPGASAAAITTTYTVQEKDILAGEIVNTATATGTDPKGESVSGSGTETITNESDPDKPDKPVIKKPEGALTVEKTADKTEGAALGEEITYTITVTNSGNVTVSDITVTDPLTGLEQSAGTLAPGASTSVTTTHTITEADILAGSFENTATATGKDPNGGDVTGEGKATVTTVEQNPALTVEKKADKTEGVALGEEITYTITVTNSGNVTVSGITVTDSKTGLKENVGTLAPKASTSVTAKYTITEDDILAGSFVNTATATGTDPDGEPVTGSGSATVTTVDAAPALTVEKKADKIEGVALGEEITYTITVTNSGNVTVSDITVTDPLTGNDDTNPLTPKSSELKPGESTSVTTTYTVQEKDILAGKVENTATATGTGANGGAVSVSDSETVTTVEQAPALTVEKTASGTSSVGLGDTITYTITVTNSGNVTVSGITVTDPLTNLNQSVGTLTPGVSAEAITTTYTVTEADILAGKIENTATATGTDPNGDPVTSSATETITDEPGEPDPDDPSKPVIEAPEGALTVEKTANKTSGAALGEEISYTITVTNSGNVTVKGIAVTDEKTGLNEKIESLAPGAHAEYTTTYTVQEADILAGSFVNAATATASDPKGGNVTGSDDETVKTAAQAPALTVVKSANKTEGANLNEEITYTITVTNSGNVTVKDITVTDEQTGLNQSAGTLAPGASTSVTTTHKITEADILAGSFVNTATAKGTDPNEDEVTGSDDETVTTAAPTPALKVEVSANKADHEELGDIVTYTITVTNSGNVTVSNITVADPLTGLSRNIGTLAPGESAAAITTTYTVLEKDIEEGSIVNTVTAKGTDPNGKEATGNGSSTVKTVDAAPELTVEKTADKTSDVNLNDVITYTITVTNSGNETVNSITVTDPLTGLNQSVGPLAPGASTSVTTKYTVNEADILSGSIVNTATATGTDPSSNEVTASGSTTVTTAEPVRSWTVEKTVSGATGADGKAVVGAVLTYKIAIKNTGNVTLVNLKVTDTFSGNHGTRGAMKVESDREGAAPTLVNGTLPSLAAGETATISYTYPVDPKDVKLENTVSVQYGEGEVTDNTSTEVEEKQDFTVEKKLAKVGGTDYVPDSKVKVGDVLTYAITVANAGNVELNGLAVSDEMNGTAIDLSKATLDRPEGSSATFDGETLSGVGIGETVTITYTYTVKATDTTLKNAATVGDKTGGAMQTETTVEETPAYSASKALCLVNGAEYHSGDKVAVGDVLTYAITVVNTGNVELNGLAVSDEMNGTVIDLSGAKLDGSETATFVDGKLSGVGIGETVTITYTYTVKATDATLTNAATVGTKTEGAMQTETAVEEAPAYSASKALRLVNGEAYHSGDEVAVGDVLTYAITVVNTGNAVLNGLAVSDEMNGAAVDLSGATLGGSKTAVFADGKLSGVGIGETVTLSYTYTVKATDITLKNAATVGDKPGDATQTETAVKKTPAYSASKALRLVNGEAYHSGDEVAVGDVLTYAITVVNTGNAVLNGLAVSDEMNGATVDLSGAELDKPEGSGATFADGKLSGVGFGETVRLTYTYTVKATDAILANAATVGTETGATRTAVADHPSIEISETITSAPANGTGYELGETITYCAVVTNNGNLALHDIQVTDPIAGMNGAIDLLPPGASETLNVSHVVTEADLLGANGYASSVVELELDDEGGINTQRSSAPSKKLTNTATAAGVASNNAAVAATVSAEAPIADVMTGVSVVEVARLNGAPIRRAAEVPVGTTIVYEITVTNNGNVTTRQTIRDVLILNGDAAAGKELPLTSKGVTYDKFKAFTIPPKQSKVFTASYTVQATDQTLDNLADVAGSESEVAMNVADTPALAVEKAADAAGPVGLNDEITYTITATNAGNVAMTDVTVSDPLTGLTQNVGALAPGASATVTTTYVVTAADVAAGSVTNTATVTGVDPDGNAMAPQSSNTVTVAALPRATLTVHYWYDAVGGAKAAPTFNATYFVGTAYSVASPSVAGYSPSRAAVAGTIARDATFDVVYTATPYTLTIHYVYEDGTVAAEAYTDTLTIGDGYTVTSPVIEGYTASEPVVAGTMPGRNVTITVIYVSETTILPIDIHGKSLNIGEVTMNVGECFE